MQTILVTGANGQLGNEFKALANIYTNYNFLFVGKDEMSIDDFEKIEAYFNNHTINFCINCAAYTAVDKAEIEKEKAFLINADAVGNLAKICSQKKIQFIHISTDYVFDGTATEPIKENHPTNPLGIYGHSKLLGEQLCLQNNPTAIIIRTSWVYSSFGNNFVKTMLRLMAQKESIDVVDDQFGCPTYAADLADAIMQIINKCSLIKIESSLYNYSNQGAINWFQFANAIKEIRKSTCIINPIPTSGYPTPAKRPLYSVLDTQLIQQIFKIQIPIWEESLAKCIGLLQQ
jgi:dTDP-4-dehydrorhamnose reductase